MPSRARARHSGITYTVTVSDVFGSDINMSLPLGISLRQPQIDCDPWGMEMVEQDVGDWSAPTASWDNANAEWKVPSPTEPQATYVVSMKRPIHWWRNITVTSNNFYHLAFRLKGESSEEEAAPVKLPSNSTQPESQSVVGISQESASQKKSRRRRKKKNLPSEQTLPVKKNKAHLKMWLFDLKSVVVINSLGLFIT